MYNLINKEFKTKDKVIEFGRDLLKKYINQHIQGEDYDFFKDLIQYHDHNYNVNDIEFMEVKQTYDFNTGDYTAITLFVKFKKGKKSIPVSIPKCVANIAPIGRNENDVILPFGKYKGMNIKDVDIKYLEWLVESTYITKSLEIRIKNHIKYGFSPYTYNQLTTNDTFKRCLEYMSKELYFLIGYKLPEGGKALKIIGDIQGNYFKLLRERHKLIWYDSEYYVIVDQYYPDREPDQRVDMINSYQENKKRVGEIYKNYIDQNKNEL